MKKVLVTISILTMVLFLFLTNIKAESKESNTYEYKEDYYSIKFPNLNSKNINELFEGINGTVIEIEVQTKIFTKAYKFNTGMIDNVERHLEEKVTKDLKSLGKYELATNYQMNGVKVIRMDIRCTKKELDTIKSRIDTE